MSLDGIRKVASEDQDTLYDAEEIAAMKELDYSKLEAETCDLADILEEGLVEDIRNKNLDYLVRPGMDRFFKPELFDLE
jgi:hypothetical protein